MLESDGSDLPNYSEFDERKFQKSSGRQGNSSSSRKIICRYGRGCTHYNDIIHREQFWHAPICQVDEEQKRNQYICNECGHATPSLQELQLHLKRKTAWSNTSLVGCRISCLIDNKEWHEGFVSQIHKSGKHFVEFRTMGERRWMNMKKIAFYIVERPPTQSSISGEYKESEIGEKGDGLAPLEDNWVYVDDVSLGYTFAQSVLFKVYDTSIQETGHKTKGHTCLTEEDRKTSQQFKGSLLYGELLPRGVNKALAPSRLNAQEASTLFDLGMGTGKVLIQSFLQFRNLKYVFGVELAFGRYTLAESAVMKMAELLGKESFRINIDPGKFVELIELVEDEKGGQPVERILRMQCGDMFEITNIHQADIIMLETDIPNHLLDNLCHLLSQMHENAKALTYLDLRKYWMHGNFPFKQMESNKNLSDRFSTSWSVQRGHHFFLWTKEESQSDLYSNSNALPNILPSSSLSIMNDLNHHIEINNTENSTHNNQKIINNNSHNNDAPKPWGCLPYGLRNLFG